MCDKRRVIIENAEQIKYQRMTTDPYFKGAVCSSLDEVLHLNAKNHRSFTLLTSNEVLKNSLVVFYFPKKSFLVEAFNHKMSQLKSAGLIDLWIAKYMEMKYLNIRHPSNGPQVIRLPQLSATFIIWLCGCLLSCLIFAAEVMKKMFQCKGNQ